MEIVFLTNSISPHQLPLCSELAKQHSEASVTYVHTEAVSGERINLGWGASASNAGLRMLHISRTNQCQLLENAKLLIADIRNISLLQRRAKAGLFTLYMSERWFKPSIGLLRLLHPKFFAMAWRFVKLLRNSNSLIYLPQGIHAARDMARLCGLMHGDLKCLFQAPELEFEGKPSGKIWLKASRGKHKEREKIEKQYCLDKMRMWGYFVEPSRFDALQVQKATDTSGRACRVLWVGRLLNLKRVDTIVQAVGEHANLKRLDASLPTITLDIYGTGPEEQRLKKLAAKYGDAIKFYPPVPIAEVRRLMREHDVYVLASNGYEGWGAVVNEALEEGMKVVGTYEAGSTATILPKKCLFRAGDYKMLCKLLQDCACLPTLERTIWSAEYAATAITHIVKEATGLW